MTESLTRQLSTSNATPGVPHIRNSLSVDGIIALYIFASMPCFILGIWQSGSQWAGRDASNLQVLASGLLLVGPGLILLLGLGFGLSRLNRLLRKQPTDLGWLGASWFFFLLLPASIDLVPALIALAFGLVFVLFVFGGQGMAPFHAALGALVFLDVTFGDPGQLIRVAPEIVQQSSWYAAVNGTAVAAFDTSLLSIQVGGLGVMSPALVTLAGMVLILTGVSSHRVILAGIAGAVTVSLLMEAPAGADEMLSTWSGHLMLGNFLFVLIFLASDPACQALTRPARWIAGFAFGCLTVLLRIVDQAHPESSLMALLLVSLCTPVLDAAVVRWFVWYRSRQHHA